VNPATGELYNVGEKVKNPELGRTLTKISEDKNGFYSGPLAEDIIKDMKVAGQFY
jgi:gamma-glutamyltranspeptidase